jgi:hypothetical protein
MSGAGLDLWQGRVLCRSDGGKLAIRAVQIGRQQTVEVADDDQRHVIGRVPVLAHVLQLFAGQVIDFRALRAF